jgi:hypothetical protein
MLYPKILLFQISNWSDNPFNVNIKRLQYLLETFRKSNLCDALIFSVCLSSLFRVLRTYLSWQFCLRQTRWHYNCRQLCLLSSSLGVKLNRLVPANHSALPMNIYWCPDKTSGDKTSGRTKRPEGKTSWRKKRPEGQNVPKDKTSGWTKRSEGQNVRKGKTSGRIKRPEGKMSEGTKLPEGLNVQRGKTSVWLTFNTHAY